MLIRRSGFTHSFQSQKLFIFSWSVQFFSNLRKHSSAVLTFAPHTEQTLAEKDSPFSRKTKSLFFSRSANLWYHSSFSVGATNTFSEFIHPLLKLPNCVLKLYNLSEALASFGLFCLRGAGTGYVDSWRILPLPLTFDLPLYILHFTEEQRQKLLQNYSIKIIRSKVQTI